MLLYSQMFAQSSILENWLYLRCGETSCLLSSTVSRLVKHSPPGRWLRCTWNVLRFCCYKKKPNTSNATQMDKTNEQEPNREEERWDFNASAARTYLKTVSSLFLPIWAPSEAVGQTRRVKKKGKKSLALRRRKREENRGDFDLRSSSCR